MRGLTILCLLLLGFASAGVAGDWSNDGVWHSIRQAGANTNALPRHYKLFQRNGFLLRRGLAAAPVESAGRKIQGSLIMLPLPGGGFQWFRIQESSIMEPALAAKFPEIKTYRAQGVDDPAASGRIALTAGGFYGFLRSSQGEFFLEPYAGSKKITIAYWIQDAPAPLNPIECLTENHAGSAPELPNAPPTGSTLHTFRVAIGATGEYTGKFGGTKSGALNSGIVPAINALNVILEEEFAVHLVLIANETDIIYTNGATDPYTDGDSSAMANENQTNLTSVIHAANYDIGHAFGGSGGTGLAYLGVVCNDSLKARAASTFSNPSGTTWIVDLVAHEMGHQFDADHSFNGTTGSCNGNRNPSTAWEPGSGTTIMSYSGSCGTENVQNFSDAFYHVGSRDEVVAHVTTRSCDVETATGNNPPTVNAGADFTIPKSTPFVLTATGSDPDSDPITFVWEEFDVGTAAPPNTDDGSRPIFRSFQPSSSAVRTFPRLQDLLNNTVTLGESLPTTNRALHFRVTARDNQTSGGGVADDAMTVTVNATAGPFVVTSPNVVTTWNGGTTQTVTWNVAGTDIPPISTANVNILLSTDGGATYPITLASATANDGSENVTVPNLSSSSARIKVEAAGNIYFDISDVNFNISTAGCTPISLSPATLPAGTVGTAYNAQITAGGGGTPYSFSVTSGAIPTSLTLAGNGSLAGTPSAAGDFSFVVTATDTNGCTGNRSYNVSVTVITCLFCDDFEDGNLDPDWTYIKPAWAESGGNLNATPSGKAIAVAAPVFGGCAQCTVEAAVESTGGSGNRVWLLGWYVDKKNAVELMMKEEADRWILKQRVNGAVVAKTKGIMTIAPNVSYDARITYNGAQFQVFINNTLLITLPKGGGTAPFGTVGFQSKATVARFGSIDVN